MAPQTFALVTLPLLSRRRVWWASAPRPAASVAPLSVAAGYAGGQAGRPTAGVTRFEPTLPPLLLLVARALAPAAAAALGAAALARLDGLGGAHRPCVRPLPTLPAAPRLSLAGWADLTSPGAWYGPEGRPLCAPKAGALGAFGPLHRRPTSPVPYRGGSAPMGGAGRAYQAAWAVLREAPLAGAPGAHAAVGGAVAPVRPRGAPAGGLGRAGAPGPAAAPGPAVPPSWAAALPAVGPLARRHQWRV